MEKGTKGGTGWREVLPVIGALAIVIVLMSGIRLAFLYFQGIEPQVTKADELIRSARAGEWEKAYQCMDEDFRSDVSIEQLRAVLRGQPGFQPGGMHTFRYFSATSEGAGTVDAEFTADDGRETTARFVLFLPVMGMHFLVTDVEVNGHSLFGKRLRQ